jgi:hypothetical protein
MGASLPISSLINVSVNLAPTAAQAQNTNVALILTNENVIDPVTRLRSYTTLAGVASDFGTTGPAYSAAAEWFAQAPQPTQIDIGRWVQTASAGQLICAPLAPAQQLLSYWTTLASAAFKISIDGGAVTNVPMAATPFAAATSLQGVAAIIQTALQTAVSPLTPTVTYNANYQRFQITSGTTGTTSSVSFMTAGTVDIDISGVIGGLSTSSGAYTVAGLAAESALAAATLFDTQFGQVWYALVMPTITADSDHVAVAGFIEATTNKHLYGVTTAEGAIISNPADTTNVAYLMKQLGYKRTFTQYSSTSAYAIVSFFGRILTVNYGGNNTTITLMYKQEPGIVAETLTSAQLATLTGFNANVFVNYNNNTAIIQNGVDAAGLYADVITGTDNFALTVQTALYNLLYLSPTKIPQTDAGTHQLTTAIESVCVQYVKNGLIAPGVWTVAGFGDLVQNAFMPTGYYVYAPSVATQTQAARLSRASVPIQVAIKLAGAVQTVNVAVIVNQ